MNYQEILDYIYTTLPMYQRIGSAAYKADLTNAVKLDEWFGRQHSRFKCIHIAGTNGKGSVSHMLASVLQTAGYKTGLYTSPHLLDFRERIRVNGKSVPEEFVTEFIREHKSVFENVQASFFEMTVFMAFAFFAREKVDFAVIEVGLGGRLDTTNIIDPILSIITNIGLDHTQFLGDTLASIAGEKAGIIKTDTPVIIGETQEGIKDLFTEKAKRLNAPVFFADDIFRIDYALKNLDHTVSWHLKDKIRDFPNPVTLDLEGIYQQKNLPPVLLALKILREKGAHIEPEKISQGLSETIPRTGFMGRWQVTATNPLTVCDVAHNAEGFRYILEQIASTPYKELHMVLGFVNDKDIRPILNDLPRRARYYLCEPDIPRAMKTDLLERLFQEQKLVYEKYRRVYDAFESAGKKTDPNDLIYIGGSTFVVADFLKGKKKNNSF